MKCPFKCQTRLNVGIFELWFSLMKYERWLKVQPVKYFRALETFAANHWTPTAFYLHLEHLRFLILGPLELRACEYRGLQLKGFVHHTSVCRPFQLCWIFKILIPRNSLFCPLQVDLVRRTLYSILANGSLLLQPLTKDHQGTWECTATNQVASVRTSTSIFVLGQCWINTIIGAPV